MDLALFALLAILELLILFLHLEHPENPWYMSAFYLTILLFGAYFFVSGIQYQTGWSSVVSGATTTHTVVTSNLVQANNDLAYLGWLGIGIGLYGIIIKILFPIIANVQGKGNEMLGDQ